MGFCIYFIVFVSYMDYSEWHPGVHTLKHCAPPRVHGVALHPLHILVKFSKLWPACIWPDTAKFNHSPASCHVLIWPVLLNSRHTKARAQNGDACKKCKLPDGSFKWAHKCYEEIHIPSGHLNRRLLWRA